MEDGGRCGDLRDGVAVAVDELPRTSFAAEDVRSAHNKRARLIAPFHAYLGSLDPHGVGELAACPDGHLLDRPRGV